MTLKWNSHFKHKIHKFVANPWIINTTSWISPDFSRDKEGEKCFQKQISADRTVYTRFYKVFLELFSLGKIFIASTIVFNSKSIRKNNYRKSNVWHCWAKQNDSIDEAWMKN